LGPDLLTYFLQGIITLPVTEFKDFEQVPESIESLNKYRLASRRIAVLRQRQSNMYFALFMV